VRAKSFKAFYSHILILGIKRGENPLSWQPKNDLSFWDAQNKE
jgi:hypothetical protein